MSISLTEPLDLRDRITDTDLRIVPGSTTVERTAMLSGVPKSTRELKYPVQGGELAIIMEGEPPTWFIPTARALVELLGLPSGWDSYGARAIDPSHVVVALEALSLIMRDDTPAPAVGPTNRGGVQLEWHARGIDLEIETLSTQRLLVSFEDSTTGSEWEREVISDLTPLVECIARLS